MFTDNEDFKNKYNQYKLKEKNMIKRISKDILEIETSSEITLTLKNSRTIILTLYPDDNSFWRNYSLKFKIKIPVDYPHKPPKIKCLNKVFHPNIDDDNGGVCLSIIREDWSPVYTLNHVFQSLLSLFYHFNIEEPLNKDAAEMFSNNQLLFANKIQNILNFH